MTATDTVTLLEGHALHRRPDGVYVCRNTGCGWSSNRSMSWAAIEHRTHLAAVLDAHYAERERADRALVPTTRTEEVEALCVLFHNTYEIAANITGWETQERSRKPWADVPEANKATMRRTLAALLASDWLAERERAAAEKALRDAADDLAAHRPGIRPAAALIGWDAAESRLRDRARFAYRTDKETTDG